MDLVIFGPPAIGKGTIAKKLVEEKGYIHLSTGELLRDHMARATPVGEMITEIMNRGELVDDGTVMSLVYEWLSAEVPEGKSVIFDGFPRTIEQYDAFRDMMRENGREFMVIQLMANDENLVTRLDKRAAEENRPEDSLSIFAGRLLRYRERTYPILAQFRADEIPVSPIDANPEVGMVMWAVRSAIERSAPAPPAPMRDIILPTSRRTTKLKTRFVVRDTTHNVYFCGDASDPYDVHDWRPDPSEAHRFKGEIGATRWCEKFINKTNFMGRTLEIVRYQYRTTKIVEHLVLMEPTVIGVFDKLVA